jgi:hypothetical protein
MRVFTIALLIIILGVIAHNEVLIEDLVNRVVIIGTLKENAKSLLIQREYLEYLVEERLQEVPHVIAHSLGKLTAKILEG